MARLSYQLKRASAELAHMEKVLARSEARTAGKRLEVSRLRLEVSRLQSLMANESRSNDPTPVAPAARAPADRSDPVAVPDRSDLPVRRTDAIVVVLRKHAGPMTPRQITDALHAIGRNDELRSVTATLAHLLKSGGVARVGRGLYTAT